LMIVDCRLRIERAGMSKRIVAIIGTYRKGRVIDTAATEVLRGARDGGAQTEAIYLIDKHIEFCTNCRSCTQEANIGRRGKCVLKDDLETILQAVDQADGLVLAAPTNYYNVTAITRRFMERTVGYAYWPWNAKYGPRMRVRPDKKAVTITSTACPAFVAKIVMPGARKALKIAAGALGARVQSSLFFGMVGGTPDETLPESARNRSYQAGRRLAESVG
jgi:multimeric flavodoxin WrbA